MVIGSSIPHSCKTKELFHMKILFLGTSHGHPEIRRFCTSVYFEHKGNGFLIDAGAPVIYLLYNYRIPITRVKSIFITHMHGDHTAELPTIAGSLWYHKEADLDCYFPQESGIDRLDHWANAKRNSQFHPYTVTDGTFYENYGIRVTAIRTEHCGTSVPSYAYMVETDEGDRVLFTGDLAYDFHDFPKIAFESHFDLIVSELVHLPADKAAEILKNVDTKLIIFSHLGESNIQTLQKHNVSFKFPYVIACDGFEYYVN